MTKNISTITTREIIEFIKSWKSTYYEPQHYEPEMQIGSVRSKADSSCDGKPP